MLETYRIAANEQPGTLHGLGASKKDHRANGTTGDDQAGGEFRPEVLNELGGIELIEHMEKEARTILQNVGHGLLLTDRRCREERK